MKIRSYIPAFALTRLKTLYFAIRLAKEYIYDYSFYLKYNSDSWANDATQLEGKIIATYHVLEKGFSHHNPKPLFSIAKFESLVDLINEYDRSGYERTAQVNVAASILNGYVNHNLHTGGIKDATLEKIALISRRTPNNDICGGFEERTREEYLGQIDSEFESFAMSRYSIRHFSESAVDIKLLEKAVKIAQKTPSVCNRQTCKAHVLTNKEDIMKHLAYHNGSRSFSKLVNKLIIVTSDVRYFEGVRERNQAFAEGGLFAMSLLYSLHHLGLGAVPLNWCYDKAHDIGMRSLKCVPDSERIIMLIAVGNIPDRFSVAKSIRRPLEDMFILR